MDFNKFKQIIITLFERDCKPIPNFALLKNAFEFIDLRKDGIIDMNEWIKAFSMTEV
jgi:Ca2+-binding EF-hand superfamily protein